MFIAARYVTKVILYTVSRWTLMVWAGGWKFTQWVTAFSLIPVEEENSLFSLNPCCVAIFFMALYPLVGRKWCSSWKLFISVLGIDCWTSGNFKVRCLIPVSVYYFFHPKKFLPNWFSNLLPIYDVIIVMISLLDYYFFYFCYYFYFYFLFFNFL